MRPVESSYSPYSVTYLPFNSHILHSTQPCWVNHQSHLHTITPLKLLRRGLSYQHDPHNTNSLVFDSQAGFGKLGPKSVRHLCRHLVPDWRLRWGSEWWSEWWSNYDQMMIKGWSEWCSNDKMTMIIRMSEATFCRCALQLLTGLDSLLSCILVCCHHHSDDISDYH